MTGHRKMVSVGALVAAAMLACSSAHAATNVFGVVNSGFSAYVINGSSNPSIKLVRGFDYTFNVNALGHPFWIKTAPGIGTGNAYNDGVTGNGTATGQVLFSVPTNAPPTLFYNCQFHAGMTGMFLIEDPPTVRIKAVSVSTNVLLSSDGTDALQVSVESRTNLTSGSWAPATVTSNLYVGGTNITEVALPPEGKSFFRVVQGFP